MEVGDDGYHSEPDLGSRDLSVVGLCTVRDSYM